MSIRQLRMAEAAFNRGEIDEDFRDMIADKVYSEVTDALDDDRVCTSPAELHRAMRNALDEPHGADLMRAAIHDIDRIREDIHKESTIWIQS